MIVIERWGEEEEVSMDVDITEEDERNFLSEIALTRGAVQYLAMPSVLHGCSSQAAFNMVSITRGGRRCDVFVLPSRRSSIWYWTRTFCWPIFSFWWHSRIVQ